MRSNSKYPFLSSLRSAAQMVSYEVSIGFVIVTVLLLVGSLNLTTIVNAQKISGKKSVTGEDVRRGLETLNMDAARLKALGLEGFAQPIKDNCEDHNGHHAAFIQQWDGAKWQKVSDWISPMQDKVRPALEADAKAYAEKNAPWPKRTEPCDAK